VLIPVKAFHQAKARLAPALDKSARAALARELADRVVDAARPHPVAVVCDDDGVAAWARTRGAEVVWRPGRGLNGAVEDGVAHLGQSGFSRVVVTHADLPLVESFDEVLTGPMVTLAPDRHEDGTNVAVLPPLAGFRFRYGPGSFDRHRAEAARLQLGPRVVRSDRLNWDIDTPADLELPRRPVGRPLQALRARG
jgi:2-phospho-L-lactate guanylyltransferase